MSSTEEAWKSRSALKLRLALQGVLVGLVAGLVIVTFRLGVETLQHLVAPLFPHLAQEPWSLAVLLGLVIYLLLGLLSGLIVRFEPLISGSGIPQVAGQLSGRLHMAWWKVLFAKVFGGLISLGAGLTLGREGPSIQMGAACGDAVGEILKRPLAERKYLISTGAASGLAAAFSAPLAGIVFALEEVHRNFSPLALLSAMTGALTADWITKTVFGLTPELSFPDLEPLPLNHYALLLILGLVMGLASWVFNHGILWGKTVYDRLPLPIWLKTALPFGLTFVALVLHPTLFGSGQALIGQMGHGPEALRTALLLYGVKFVLLMLAFCSGLPGGIFFPLLVLGAFLGSALGNAFVLVGWLEPVHLTYFMILAMAGHLSGIVRAPITGIMLISEMTGNFTNLLPVALVSVVAYLVADALQLEPIYESLLDRLLAQRRPDLACEGERLEARLLLEFAVQHAALADGRAIRDLRFPPEALIVAVKRGRHELLPKGDLRLEGGDYLVVLLPKKDQASVEAAVLDLCQA